VVLSAEIAYDINMADESAIRITIVMACIIMAVEVQFCSIV
jgi:hypothetical protein